MPAWDQPPTPPRTTLLRVGPAPSLIIIMGMEEEGLALINMADNKAQGLG